MDALYSGFSYASNEIRRAAQPAIDAMAAVLPTFGCGEGAVKQSAGNLIHELESRTIVENHANKNSMGWGSTFSSIKKLFSIHLKIRLARSARRTSVGNRRRKKPVRWGM